MNKKVLHTMIDAQAVENGSGVAIRTGSRSMSYKELMEYSNGIGHVLLGLGLRPGEVVGVYLGTGIGYMSGILGINKAGGVFMPLELSYPEKRLQHLLERVRPAIILTDEKNRSALLTLLEGIEGYGALPELVLLEEAGLAITGHCCDASPVGVEVDGEWGNYLLYTSGSTGNPKIIEGCHKGLSHFIHWEVKEFGLDRESRVSQLVPLSFDVSLRDIFTPLLAGGTLCIPPEGIRTSGRKLLEWIGDSGVTLIHTVPSVFRLLTRELESDGGLVEELKRLRYILLSGEALYGKDVLAWRRVAGESVGLVNLYGPTETTLAKIFNRIEEVEDAAGIIPLGVPLPNTSIIICNDGVQSKIGAIGEIHIKTPFRSKGYYGDAELTASSFIQNPLHGDYEDIVYRTGDLGKYLPDRRIAFVGRQDSQVKIRGNRVELSETERVMNGYPGISQVVVVALRRQDESDVLASYYVSDREVDHEELRGHLRAWLPEYMHPSYYVRMEELPLNLNGKVNKKALPRPEELLYEKTGYVAPCGEMEERLSAIWSSVLGLEKTGVENSFFDLGGHSLTATKAISRICRELGVELSLKEFFEHATVRRLARLLAERRRTAYQRIEPIGWQEDYELSHAQRLIWVLDQGSSGMIAYNMPASCLLNGRLDKEAFNRAFGTLIDRHETLRTTFHVVGGEPRQRVHEQIAFRVTEEEAGETGEWEEAGEMSEPEKAALIGRYVEEEFSRPFDLERGPLLRARLVRLSAEQHLFLFTMHHIISDGWSMGVVAREILELYSAYSEGRPDPLPPLRVQYKDYAAWHNQLLGSGGEKPGGWLETARAYWHGKLSGELPVLELPADHVRSGARTYAGDKLRFTLDRETSDSIRQLCSEEESSLFMFFLSVINILL